jgi:N-acetylneuraminate synthase
MSVLFVIPARGVGASPAGVHTERVGGIPLVGRTARLAHHAAASLGAGGRIVCATDDEPSARGAAEWGAEVMLVETLALGEPGAPAFGRVFEAMGAPGHHAAVVFLDPLSPLAAVEDVIGALQLHRATTHPVVSVCAADDPAARTYRADETGRLAWLRSDDPAADRHRGSPAYRENRAIAVSTPARLRQHQPGPAPETIAFVMPPERSVRVRAAADLSAVRAAIAGRAVAPMAIANRIVGPGHPCFVIAEAGVNHNGDAARAKALVDAAAAAGATAVKFQTFRADRVVTRDARKAEYQARTTGDDESQFDMLKRLELGEEVHHALMERCRAVGVLFLSTPFDEQSCDFLDALGVPAFKIPSGEVTNLPFIRHVARKGKPVILSTGMARLREVADAVDTIWEEGNRSLVLLHCVSNYPTLPEDANLRAMATLREAFGTPVGFSDHTLGDHVALAAVALGAAVIEKHLTLDCTLPGPDHRSSIEPRDLALLVRRLRDVEASLGTGRKEPVAREADVAQVARRSIVAAHRIPAGTVLERSMVAMRRPGTGLAPDQLPHIVGRTALVDIPEGALLARDMLE